jgi:hypothetical protein
MALKSLDSYSKGIFNCGDEYIGFVLNNKKLQAYLHEKGKETEQKFRYTAVYLPKMGLSF